jgi:site-specific recombinase XerD
MTQERISSSESNWPGFYENLESHPLYFDIRPFLAPQVNFPPQRKSIPHISRRDRRFHEGRRRGLEAVMRKLWEKDLPGKSHIEGYLRDQYRRNLKPSTLTNSFTTIDLFLSFFKARGKRYLEEIEREDLEGWIEHEQDRGIKSTTIRMRLDSLKAFLRFLIEKDILHPEVLSRRMMIKIPDALPRAMDPDDVDQLLRVIDHVRDRAMILVLLRTGMRIGELLNTLVEDVNLKERRIEIYEADKTRSGRVVYLSDDALEALKKWYKARDVDKEYVFYALGRHTMTYTAARMMFIKYLQRAGIYHKGYTLHCLRHSFATDLLNAGMRLEYLQPLLGHSSIEMTRRYARLTDKSREEEYFKAMEKIERGEIDECYQLYHQLPQTPQEEKLFCSHDQELHEHP